jgi:DMSO/TMAO reductase YedYZ molybdopterin-dependent catalytic subunit
MPFTRRLFLQGTGSAALGLSLVRCETQTITAKGGGGAFSFLTPVDRASTGELPGQRAPGTFFVQRAGSSIDIDFEDIPVKTAGEWSLTIDGEVANQLSIDLANLQARSADVVTVLKTIRCIIDFPTRVEVREGELSPGLVGTALWTGVPLRVLMEEAGVDMQTTRRFRIYGYDATDGVTQNLTLQEVMDAPSLGRLEPILAWGMNDGDIPHAHGGPVRLIVPGEYGYKQMKWLERIEASPSDEEFGTYQEVVGYFDDGTVQVVSKLTNPIAAQRVPAGRFDLFGFALSGSAAVSRVEVAVDGADFAEAELSSREEILAGDPMLMEAVQFQSGESYPLPDVWAPFRFELDLEPGEHTVRVKASDANGNVQPDTDTDPLDGSNSDFRLSFEAF